MILEIRVLRYVVWLSVTRQPLRYAATTGTRSGQRDTFHG
jgi:hypothetical protein